MWTFIFISLSRICTSCCMEGRWPDSSLDHTGTSMKRQLRNCNTLCFVPSPHNCINIIMSQRLKSIWSQSTSPRCESQTHHLMWFQKLLWTLTGFQSYCWGRTPSCRHISGRSRRETWVKTFRTNPFPTFTSSYVCSLNLASCSCDGSQEQCTEKTLFKDCKNRNIKTTGWMRCYSILSD